MDNSPEQSTKKEPLFRSVPRVLIIDPHEGAAKLAAFDLNRLGLTDITIVLGLREANDRLLVEWGEELPDLIISGYRLPGEEEDGISFARKVHDRRFRNPPFFVIRTLEVDEVQKRLDADQYAKDSVQLVLSKRKPFNKRLVEELQRRELAWTMRTLR